MNHTIKLPLLIMALLGFSLPAARAEMSHPDVSHSQSVLSVPVKAGAVQPAGIIQNQIELYSRILQRDNRNTGAYNNRGVYRAQAGDLPGALADFKAVLQINPGDPEALHNLGNCLAASGNYAQAIAYFSQAIKADSKHVSSYYGRGRLRRALGDRAGADVDLRTAARIYLQRGQDDSYREIMDELQTPLVYQ